MLRTHKKGGKEKQPLAAALNPDAAAMLRIQGELASLGDELPAGCMLQVDNQNPRHLIATITPESGWYAHGSFQFHVTVPEDYPYSSPNVKCDQPIFHPNIDDNGTVCLNILGLGWKPVHSLYSIVIGLLDIMYNPHVDDPLNKEAAEMLKNSPKQFARHAKRMC